MPCETVLVGGTKAIVCYSAGYEIEWRGRVYNVDGPHGISGPAFFTRGDEPWKRQPYDGELWAIGQRMIWGMPRAREGRKADPKPFEVGEERRDAPSEALVRRVR